MARIGYIVVAVCMLGGSWASASVINGGFETGDLSGWSATGDVSVQTDALGVAPTDGAYDALLTTLGSNDVNGLFQAISPFSGNAAVASATLEGVLGLGAGSLGGVEGSLLTQTFNVAAGDTLEFDWNFLTDEAMPPIGYNDYAFVVINGNVINLASASSSLGASSAGFSRESGWQSYVHTFTSAGSVSLAFGVLDRTDDLVTSALLIDGVNLLTDKAVVPEPASATLVLLGISALGLRAARRNRA